MPKKQRRPSIRFQAVFRLILCASPLLGCARDLGRGAAQGAVGEFERFLDKPETQARINRLIDSGFLSARKPRA